MSKRIYSDFTEGMSEGQRIMCKAQEKRNLGDVINMLPEEGGSLKSIPKPSLKTTLLPNDKILPFRFKGRQHYLVYDSLQWIEYMNMEDAEAAGTPIIEREDPTVPVPAPPLIYKGLNLDTKVWTLNNFDIEEKEIPFANLGSESNRDRWLTKAHAIHTAPAAQSPATVSDVSLVGIPYKNVPFWWFRVLVLDQNFNTVSSVNTLPAFFDVRAKAAVLADVHIRDNNVADFATASALRASSFGDNDFFYEKSSTEEFICFTDPEGQLVPLMFNGDSIDTVTFNPKIKRWDGTALDVNESLPNILDHTIGERAEQAIVQRVLVSEDVYDTPFVSALNQDKVDDKSVEATVFTPYVEGLSGLLRIAPALPVGVDILEEFMEHHAQTALQRLSSNRFAERPRLLYVATDGKQYTLVASQIFAVVDYYMQIVYKQPGTLDYRARAYAGTIPGVVGGAAPNASFPLGGQTKNLTYYFGPTMALQPILYDEFGAVTSLPSLVFPIPGMNAGDFFRITAADDKFVFWGTKTLHERVHVTGRKSMSLEYSKRLLITLQDYVINRDEEGNFINITNSSGTVIPDIELEAQDGIINLGPSTIINSIEYRLEKLEVGQSEGLVNYANANLFGGGEVVASQSVGSFNLPLLGSRAATQEGDDVLRMITEDRLTRRFLAPSLTHKIAITKIIRASASTNKYSCIVKDINGNFYLGRVATNDGISFCRYDSAHDIKEVHFVDNQFAMLTQDGKFYIHDGAAGAENIPRIMDIIGPEYAAWREAMPQQSIAKDIEVGFVSNVEPYVGTVHSLSKTQKGKSLLGSKANDKIRLVFEDDVEVFWIGYTFS